MAPAAPMRTGEIVPAAGIWEIRCSREGCLAVTEISLRQGAPAPPCVRCLNRAIVFFLRENSPTEEGDRRFRMRRGLSLAELPAAPAPATTEEKAIAPAPAAEEKPSALSLWGWRDVPKAGEVPTQIATVNSEEKPAVKKPTIAEEKLSLMQRLTIKKPVRAPSGRK